MEDDEVSDIYTVKTLDRLLVFTDKGKAYSIKVYEIPEASKQARGRLISNIINLGENENVSAILNTSGSNENSQILIVTRKGIYRYM